MITNAIEMRELRLRLGLTQRQMAQRLGISAMGYYGIESQRTSVRKVHGLAASFIEIETLGRESRVFRSAGDANE